MQSQAHRARPGQAPTKPHSVRCLEETWIKAKRQSDLDDVTMNYAITELLEGYARGFLNLPMAGIKKPKSGAERAAAHSIRCTDELWNSAKRRAKSEGITMNDVIVGIMDAYARGLMNLPTVTKSFVRTKELQ